MCVMHCRGPSALRDLGRIRIVATSMMPALRCTASTTSLRPVCLPVPHALAPCRDIACLPALWLTPHPPSAIAVHEAPSGGAE
jgi:hypothetical protein